MTVRLLLITALVATALTGVALLVLDAPVARFVAADGAPAQPILRAGTRVLEIALGLTLPRFLVDALLLTLIAALWRRHTALARHVVFVGATVEVARLVAGLAKPWFGRLRPYEALRVDELHHSFFYEDGHSFPSGHVAHFAAVYFAFVVLFPRLRWPLAVLPAFIIAARIGVNQHFVSDTTSSVAIAALLAALFAWLVQPR